jgi:long-chain acyl-CoA synthetase
VFLFLQGGRIGYISGDIATLLDDCRELKPTNIPMVPRLLNKLYDRVASEVGNSKVKSYLLKKAIESKERDRKMC